LERAKGPRNEGVIERSSGRTRGDLPSDADLTRAVKARPQLAMAALALAAVGRFGGSAVAQAEWLHNTYPQVAADRLARVAVATAMKRTRYAVGASIVGGPIGVAAGVSTLTWAKARLVLDVAAIFGHDPLDPTRAADVLVLLGAYPDGLAAGKAVAELADDAGGTDLTARDTLLASASAQLVTRAAGRVLPGLGALALASVSMTETERLAEAAIHYYRRSLRHAF
jgi:hypothetical protein